MNLPSLWSATPATRRRRALDGAELSLEVGANEVGAETREADEVNSKESEDEVASKDTITTIAEEVVVVRGVEDDLAGKTMTSHNEIAMRLSTSSLTGRCWRRLISTVWRS